MTEDLDQPKPNPRPSSQLVVQRKNEIQQHGGRPQEDAAAEHPVGQVRPHRADGDHPQPRPGRGGQEQRADARA